jgi:membrane-associated protein
MTLDAITEYLQLYGYWVIIFVLFFGIMGIPAPEETFIIFIGAVIAEQRLDFAWAICVALVGANFGMFITYMIGRKLGTSMIEKYGNVVKITPERWRSIQAKFDRFDHKILIIGYFLPGLRQLTPYMSGTRELPYIKFFSLTFLGSLLWTTLYMTIGFYFGNMIGLKYLSFIALIFFFVFVLGLLWKNWLSPARNKVSS